jgi:hypothetical protein
VVPPDRSLQPGRSGKSCTYTQRFADEYGLGAALHEQDGLQWLEADEPATLASLVAFCKGEARVCLRGQHAWRGELLPSLFRGASSPGERAARWGAYRAFTEKLRRVVTGSRFWRPDFGAVLQHYGFRTPWLDVLDDTHAAVWFALHGLRDSEGPLQYRRIDAACGWIVVLSVTENVRLQDLRSQQSSRSTRCHVQQGFSLAMQPDDATALSENQDFAGYVAGVVRIPNEDRWHLRGFRATQAYLFPGSEVDNTYKQLLAPRISELAAEAEQQHGLPSGTLGRVGKYNGAGDDPAI